MVKLVGKNKAKARGKQTARHVTTRQTGRNPLRGRGQASLVDDIYHGPARVPCKRHDGEGRFPSHPSIALKIAGEPAFPVIAKNAGVTGSKQRSVVGKQESAAGF